jgi:dihydroorotate dehydrogenase
MLLAANRWVIYDLKKFEGKSKMSTAGVTAAADSSIKNRLVSKVDILKTATAAFRMLPPNLAHKIAIKSLQYGLVPKLPRIDDPILAIKLWDIEFRNPIGISAGFDKNAEVIDGLCDLGFGFSEIGTVTPLAQAGNPRPNLFRLPEDKALINRLGFPSQGVAVFVKNLEKKQNDPAGVVGINVGINTGSDNPTGDIEYCLKNLARFAAYITINVSCPNTPGLCAWQAGDKLAEMVECAKSTLAQLSCARKPPLLVKIGPELTEGDLAAVADVALTVGLDGLIACNTSGERPPTLKSANSREVGGLSGPPIGQQALKTLSKLYNLTEGRIPLIGCGGISTADDAYARIRAGASLLQLYTALIYGGPRLVSEIKNGLIGRLRSDGYNKLSDAVGRHLR